MSKFRFAGTLKEIAMDKSGINLKFIPDQEYASSYKKDKDTTVTFALLQPVGTKVGCLFEYSNHVVLTLSSGTPCHHLTLNLHCMLELDTTSGSGICDVIFSDIPASAKGAPFGNTFAISAVRAF